MLYDISQIQTVFVYIVQKSSKSTFFFVSSRSALIIFIPFFMDGLKASPWHNRLIVVLFTPLFRTRSCCDISCLSRNLPNLLRGFSHKGNSFPSLLIYSSFCPIIPIYKLHEIGKHGQAVAHRLLTRKRKCSNDVVFPLSSASRRGINIVDFSLNPVNRRENNVVATLQ
jgi:hypothetical protein